MSNYTQSDQVMSLTTPAGKDVFLLLSASGREAVSELFQFELDALVPLDKTIDFEKILGQKITITFNTPSGQKRYINGICNRLSAGERDADFTRWSLGVAPQFWLLTRRTQSRIFQHLTVPDILKKVLQGLDVSYEIKGTFEPRDFCVQYRESDFNFATRLMEEEGIFYYFEHADGSHKLVVANHSSVHKPIPGRAPKVVFEDVLDGNKPDNRVFSLLRTQELRSGKTLLWDHCFELPHKHLESEKTIQESVVAGKVTHKFKIAPNEKLELYDHPGEYAKRFDGVDKGGGEQPADLQKIFNDGKRTVDLRMQEEAARGLVFQGVSNCREFCSGFKFTLDRHYDADGEYVLTSVQHSASQEGAYRSDAAGVGFHYENEFTCIPTALPYRPPRLARRPIIPGTHTAVVVGPPGEEIFTDKYGRVKVQIHWDREGKSNADSSCWVRVGQIWAGRRWGASFWPRVGQEVILAFQEGDPDQPIIVGSVYNAEQMPPYLGDGPDAKHKKDNKVSGVKSNSLGGAGFNEMRMDDAKGKEQLFFHAERDMDCRVKHDSRERILNDRHLIVGGGEKNDEKVGDQRELVYKDKHLNVKGDQVEKIEGNFLLTVGKGEGDGGDVDVVIAKNKKEYIELNDDLKVMLNRSAEVQGNDSITIGGNRNEKVGLNAAVEAGMMMHVKAGMTLVLEAGLQLTLKVGPNFIDISPVGIAIQGTMLMLNSGGAAGAGAGCSPTSPEKAKEASPKKPDEADNAKSGLCSRPS